MAKKKEEIIKVTQSEMINCTIIRYEEMWNKEKESAQRIAASDPVFARQIIEDSVWRKKIKILLQLYKIETGNDYGLDIELE